jgi:site-specific recombinase XerD
MPNPSALTLAQLIHDFFCQRLCSQRRLSPATVASYRDTFCLLLDFAARRTGHPHPQLQLEDLAAPLILQFLDHLEVQRRNTVRTRNARLAAIHAFMRYVAQQEPTALALSSRVLAIPYKRFDRPLLGYLSVQETQALLQAPDRSTWSGQRDGVLLELLYQTGARVSEIVALNRQDVHLEATSFLQLQGKGRKQRQVLLTKASAARLKDWLAQLLAEPLTPLFANYCGHRLSRFGVVQRLRLTVQKALPACPSLKGRKISPHTLRHTTAMHLLQNGVDFAAIALWLGHESMATTHQYVEADLDLKKKTLAKLAPPNCKRSRYKPSDQTMAFLRSL